MAKVIGYNVAYRQLTESLMKPMVEDLWRRIMKVVEKADLEESAVFDDITDASSRTSSAPREECAGKAEHGWRISVTWI